MMAWATSSASGPGRRPSGLRPPGRRVPAGSRHRHRCFRALPRCRKREGQHCCCPRSNRSRGSSCRLASGRADRASQHVPAVRALEWAAVSLVDGLDAQAVVALELVDVPTPSRAGVVDRRAAGLPAWISSSSAQISRAVVTTMRRTVSPSVTSYSLRTSPRRLSPLLGCLGGGAVSVRGELILVAPKPCGIGAMGGAMKSSRSRFIGRTQASRPLGRRVGGVAVSALNAAGGPIRPLVSHEVAQRGLAVRCHGSVDSWEGFGKFMALARFLGGGWVGNFRLGTVRPVSGRLRSGGLCGGLLASRGTAVLPSRDDALSPRNAVGAEPHGAAGIGLP